MTKVDSQMYVFVDVGEPSPSAYLRTGQTLLLVLYNASGHQQLDPISLPAEYFKEISQAERDRPGQPLNSHVVASGLAIRAGSGEIILQWRAVGNRLTHVKLPFVIAQDCTWPLPSNS